jgi:predicted ATPase/tRNA A-37 threonylcarbamoyl transferase component Bud32
MPLPPGARLGSYEIRSLLGRGGMGEVYLAEDTRLRRKVAIKLLLAESVTDEQARTRLLREARAAAALDHSNICAVYEIGEINGQSFIVMQYVEGETLAERMKHKPLDMVTAIGVATQVAAALAEAQRHGIVHRDIKPQNIMLSPRGQVKVLDFGLAKSTSLADEAASVNTGTGMVVGTVPYMSPEQLRGEEADGRSDIFSFGILLHEMIAGRHPFSASSIAGTISAILTEPPPPLVRDAGDAVGELQRIVGKCLEKDREWRYQTMRDLEIDLENEARKLGGQRDSHRVPAPAAVIPRTPSKATSLPIPQTPLVGRDHERMAARALLLRPDVRLVTFTGAGGTGKTRLALQVAVDLEEEFGGRVYFVALASIADSGLVVPTVAEVFGVREVGSREPTQALKDAITALQAPLLLLLDNFEQVLDAAPLLTGLLASCANLKVLVTSRAVLRLSGEHDFQVPPLALPARAAHPSIAELARSPAVALFVQRATAVKPDFSLTPETATAVAEICAKLDGLPLAIELAAARVRMLTPAAMLQRLESRFELLTGGARDLPARQRTLRATVEWSHGLLSPEVQTLFRRLSVFVNGCTLEAVEAVCNADETLEVDILDAMESLVGQSLVQQIQPPDLEPRFTMLETMREFGLQRLAASPDETLTRRAHAAYCIVLAEEGAGELGPEESARWLARCDLEQDNFRAALEWTTRERELEWGLRLGAALHAFWHARGKYSEGRERLGLLLGLSGQVTPKTRARALNAAGYMATGQGDLALSRLLYDESLAISRNLGDIASEVTALNALAYSEALSGDGDRARALFHECVELAEKAGSERAVAQSLVNLGHHILKYGGDPEAAQPLYERALKIAERLNDVSVVAMCLSHLGDVARARKDTQTARGMYERAIATSGALGDRWAVALTLVDLGRLFCDQGEHRACHQRLAQALGLAREIGYHVGIAHGLAAFAQSAARRGQAERAMRLAGAAGAIRHTLGAPRLPIEEIELTRDLDPARRALGASAAEAETAGARMSIEDAIEFALGEEI